MYKWKCVKCGKEVTWDGEKPKPGTVCEGKLLNKHNKVQMPLREVPKSHN
jgi:DNA-directed RNA polymerase subunit RPC12/RpoP